MMLTAFTTLAGAEVSFVNSPDFETKASYTINVVATDALNNEANQDVVITIIDVDEEAPTVVVSSSCNRANRHESNSSYNYI